MNKAVLRILAQTLLLLAAPPAVNTANAAQDRYVFVTPAWQPTMPQPFNTFAHSGKSKTSDTYWYQKRLQQDIITALCERGVRAAPCLMSSGLPFMNGYSRQEVDSLVAAEPIRPGKQLTLVPIITTGTATQTKTFMNMRVTVNLCFELRQLLPDRTLGEVITDFTTKTSVMQEGYQLLPGDYTQLMDDLSGAVKTRCRWDNCINYISARPESGGIPRIDRETVEDVIKRKRSYLGWYMVVNANPADNYHRIQTSHFKVLAGKVDDIKDVTVKFNASYESPSILYGYITSPAGKITTFGDNDAHPEQLPDAVPGQVFTSHRLLVINLPEAVPGAVVSYCVGFMSQSSDGTGREVCRDFQLPYTDTDADWSVILITDDGRPSYRDGFGLSGITERNYAAGTHHYRTYAGKLPTVLPGIWEPMHAYREPAFRLSTEPTWESVNAPVRDSIIRMIAQFDGDLPSGVTGTGGGSADLVYRATAYMEDSLRYVANAFGQHTAIPSPPGRVLRERVGDCKDRTTLFCTMMRAGGITAYPAVVNGTDNSAVTASGIPSHSATDHMIAYLPDQGWWVDPTHPVLPPWITPHDITGGYAVVMYPDSIGLQKIETNPDSAYTGTYDYELEVDGADVKAAFVETCSHYGSSHLRGWMDEFTPDEIRDLLFGHQRQGRRYRCTETSFSVENRDNPRLRLVIHRTFRYHNAVTKIAGKTVLHLPETPLTSLLPFIQLPDRKSPMKVTAVVRQRTRIHIKTPARAVWPAFSPVRDPLFSYRTAVSTAGRTLTADMVITSATIPADRYGAFCNVLHTWHDLFSSAVILN